MNAKVSIIIPLYNSKDYIAECLDSIVGQDYGNLEIIVVDDGSTDGSLEIVRSYDDPRIRAVSQANQGAGTARNRGIEESTGDYLTFLDSDDAFHPRFISTLVEGLESHGADVSCCWMRHFSHQLPEAVEFESARWSLMDGYEALEEAFAKRRVRWFVWNKLFTRSIIQGMEFCNSGADDHDFVTRILLNAENVAVTDLELCWYRQRPGSASFFMGSKYVMDLMRVAGRERTVILDHDFRDGRDPSDLFERSEACWMTILDDAAHQSNELKSLELIRRKLLRLSGEKAAVPWICRNRYLSVYKKIKLSSLAVSPVIRYMANLKNAGAGRSDLEKAASVPPNTAEYET